MADPEQELSLKDAGKNADSARVNVILVPALLLLIGLVVYKKIIEPRKGGSQGAKPAKSGKAQKTKPMKIAEQKVKKGKAESTSRPRQLSSSGRMGSVL